MSNDILKMQSRSMRENIIIHGIPETNKEIPVHGTTGENLPIVAKVADTKMKISIMGRGKELRGTNFFISNHYPAEILRRRRLLHPIMTEARQNRTNARLVIDKLYINGKLGWLGGKSANLGQ